MEAAFIAPETLAALAGKRLFYPAAGSDWNEILLQFADYIDEFHFCDNGRLYWDLEALQSEWPFENPSLYRRLDRPEVDGPSQAKPDPAIGYPNLERGYLREIYQRLADGRQLKVVRRRGFGQCALAEFPAQSIGVFVHRGDSPTQGEGGSNLYFLANKKRDYEPSSNLFDKLALRLSDGALIVSDGSNAHLRRQGICWQSCVGDGEEGASPEQSALRLTFGDS